MTPRQNRSLAKARAARKKNAARRERERARTRTAYGRWLKDEARTYRRMLDAREAGNKKAEVEALAAWRAILRSMPRYGSSTVNEED